MLRGDRLKELRLAKGLKQAELGKLVNITKVSICGYEKSNRTPNLETLLDICEVLETSPNYLLGSETNVVMEKEEDYSFHMSKEEIGIIKELRKFPNLYNKMIDSPKRIIELISTKFKS